MNKILIFTIGILLLSIKSFGQNKSENIVYVVDKITVREDPEKGNEITQSDIADMNVIKNKDSLKTLGFDKFDGAIFIYTKEYRKRPEEIKQMPSSKQMERKNGIWYFNNEIYNGKFIDYYYSGRIQGNGILKYGKLEGLRKMYYQNGNLSVERNYTNSISDGLEKEYYEDGTLKQKGIFINGSIVNALSKSAIASSNCISFSFNVPLEKYASAYSLSNSNTLLQYLIADFLSSFWLLSLLFFIN